MASFPEQIYQNVFIFAQDKAIFSIHINIDKDPGDLHLWQLRSGWINGELLSFTNHLWPFLLSSIIIMNANQILNINANIRDDHFIGIIDYCLDFLIITRLIVVVAHWWRMNRTWLIEGAIRSMIMHAMRSEWKYGMTMIMQRSVQKSSSSDDS